MVTGVYGQIGGATYFRLIESPDTYDAYGLARRREPSKNVPEAWRMEVPEEKFTLSDMSDLDEVTQAMEGMDTVVHMAAMPNLSRGWEGILESNMIGAYNIFEGCRLAGVKRIIYASSIQASSGYSSVEPYKAIVQGRYEDVPDPIPLVTHEMPTWPTNIYAASKVWGEALSRTYADSHGMSCICLRIGWVRPDDRPPDLQRAYVWCSQRDIVQLIERCINAPEHVRFDIFYGMSDNRYRWVDIEHAREVVGYVPQDRGEDRLEESA